MGVEFNEGDDLRRADYSQTQKSKIGSWLIARGLAKDEASANKIQITAALIFFVIAIFLFFR